MIPNPSLRPRARGTVRGHLTHTRYVGDATVLIEHLGDHDYDVEIVLPRSQRDSEWSSIIAAPGAPRDPNDDAFIDRVAATAVQLAVTDEGLEDIADATAWAVDGQGGYDVLKGNPEGRPPGVPTTPPVKNPSEVWTSFGERIIRNRAKPQTVAVRVIKESMGWRVDHTEVVAGAWMPWEPALEGPYKTKTAAEKAALDWAVDENISLEGFKEMKKNPAGLTAKGERMYEHVKAGYAGDPRAKEIAARTVSARAGEGAGGLKKNPNPEYMWFVTGHFNRRLPGISGRAGEAGLKIFSGWEHKSDAFDDLKDNKSFYESTGAKHVGIMSRRNIGLSGDESSPDEEHLWFRNKNPLSATEAAKVRDMFRGKKNPTPNSPAAKLRPLYSLVLTDPEYKAVKFAAHKYEWASALSDLAMDHYGADRNVFSGHESDWWQVAEAIEAENSSYPLASPKLAQKINRFMEQFV